MAALPRCAHSASSLTVALLLGAAVLAPFGGSHANASPHRVAAKKHKSVTGDINGDGRSDLVVSVKGGFEVRYAGTSQPVTVSLPQNSTASSVAVGDFNHDGYADVAVGDPISGYDSDTQDYDGSFLVYLGGPHGLGATPTTFDGPSGSGGYFGQMLVAADLNHDGYRDLIEVADHGGGMQAFVGGPDGLTAAPSSIFGDCPTNFDVADVGGTLGVATGDVNGDGRSDLVVGLPGAGKKRGHGDNFRNYEGQVKVCDGTKHGFGAVSTKIGGLAAGTGYRGLGSAIAIAKVNGDKYNDIIAGASDYIGGGDGRVAVLYGGRHGPASAHDSVLGKYQPQVYGSSGNLLGATVAAADVNGDGYADVIAGGPYGGRGKDAAGEVVVFYGSKHGAREKGRTLLTLHRSFPSIPTGTATETAQFGAALTTYQPSKKRLPSIAALAPGYQHGLLAIYRGAKSGVKEKKGTRSMGVGGYAKFSTGAALAP